MRQIVLDTETTGLATRDGNRIIEVGCVELVGRKKTGNTFHAYINPERDSEPGALNVHGLDTEFLGTKPLFKDVVEDLLAYLKGAELIIHNAPFDVGFLNYEFSLLKGRSRKITDDCTILDSLVLAKRAHPGKANSLDALCKRYFVDNTSRTMHGALLDSELLADVYLRMTGGQVTFDLGAAKKDVGASAVPLMVPRDYAVIQPVAEEKKQHTALLEMLRAKSERCLWDVYLK